MRNRSPANRAASSPPVPARTSRMAEAFSSLSLRRQQQGHARAPAPAGSRPARPVRRGPGRPSRRRRPSAMASSSARSARALARRLDGLGHRLQLGVFLAQPHDLRPVAWPRPCAPPPRGSGRAPGRGGPGEGARGSFEIGKQGEGRPPSAPEQRRHPSTNRALADATSPHYLYFSSYSSSGPRVRTDLRRSLPMAEAYIVAATRTAGGRKGGKLAGLASGRSRRRGAQQPHRPHRRRSGPGRGRDHGLRRPGRRAGAPTSPAARCWPRAARERAGHQRRPPVRLLAAGPALRRPGGDERHAGHRHRRRRREHDPRAHGHCR